MWKKQIVEHSLNARDGQTERYGQYLTRSMVHQVHDRDQVLPNCILLIDIILRGTQNILSSVMYNVCYMFSDL